MKIKRKRKLIRIGIFCLILLIICLILTPILQKKWLYSEDSATTEIAKGFYAEPDDTLDVIYLGSSYIKNGISPLEIWKRYGITGYIRGTAQQAPVVSYYLAKETFKTQSPKVVVFEAATLIQAATSESNDYDARETKLHEAMDYMKWSKEKLQLAREIVQNSNLTYFDLLSPLYRYHERWAEISKNDFKQDLSIKNYAYKGQYPSVLAAAYTEAVDYMKEGEQREEAQLEETSAEYVIRLKELCEDNGAQLILLHVPCVSWDDNKSNIVEEFAETYGITFLDYSSNELRKSIGYDSATDTNDYGLHLNMLGAEKVSLHFGKYLKDHFEFEDKRDQDEYGQWAEDYGLYMGEKKIAQLKQATDLISYLEELENSDCIAIFAAKSDAGTFFTDEIHDRMSKLGLTEDLNSSLYCSYIGITDGSNALYEKMAGEQITYSGTISDKYVSVISNTRRGQNSSVSIQIDGEELAIDENGLNIVVYSTKFNRVVGARAYNTGVNGRLYTGRQSLDSIDFETYTERINNSRYVVALSVTKDTAKCLTPKVAAKIQTLGFDKNLKELFVRPYIGVSNGGYSVLEESGENSQDKIEGSVEVEGIDIRLVSDGNNSSAYSSITINGEEYNFPTYGLNFVVYDKYSGEVVSVRSFITSSYSYTDSKLFSSSNNINAFLSAALDLSKEYTVIVSSKGETGNEAIRSLLQTVSEKGLSLKLNENDGGRYFGIIDNGEVVYENESERIEDIYMSDYKEIVIRQGIADKEEGIFIEDINYLNNEEGVQIVVFDKKEDVVVMRKTWN